MSILRRAASGGGYPQFNNYMSPLSQLYGATTTTSGAGERVDEWTSLGVSSVLAAVSLLADSVASLPLRQYDIVGGERVASPLAGVLADPDPESSTYELVHQTVASMALHGNAYIHVARDRRGNPIGAVPLHPYQMQVLASQDQVSRRYLHLGNEMDSANIIHLRWFTPPQSLVGISPLIQSRNLIGLSLAMDRHLAQFYAEGATPSSVIEVDEKLTIDQARIIQDTWTSTHRRHRKPAVLSKAHWKPIQTSAADQQMIETREQLIRDVARIYRVPAHLIGARGDAQTYQNVEQASLNFLTHTITPWLIRVEKGFSKLLPAGSDVVFDFSSLLRADSLTRARVDLLKVQMGARNPNEVRVADGFAPYAGGDSFHQSLSGTVTAGGDQPALGADSDTSTPVMGVLEQ